MIRKEDVKYFEEVFERHGSSITWVEDKQYKADKKYGFSEDDKQFLKEIKIKL